MISLREAAAALATGHALFTCVGIGSAASARSATTTTTEDLTSHAPHVRNIVALASQMYSGGGLDPDVCAANVTFTDPVACCVGKHEVMEAFRALKYCHPEHIEAPRAQCDGDHLVLVHLHQRYFASAWWRRGLEVKSTLLVTSDSSGRVCQIEERWNGAPLHALPVFRWVRRLNGIASGLLTPLLLR